MALFFRKSFKLGPLRINLSKGGLGVSLGAGGMRAGVNARGRPYVSAAKGGLRYLKTLPKSPARRRTTRGRGRGGKR